MGADKILSFQPFSLAQLDESTVVIGGSGRDGTEGGVFAVVEVSTGPKELQQVEMPEAVMKLSSLASSGIVVASFLHSPYCHFFRTHKDKPSEDLGRIQTVPEQYEQSFACFDPSGSFLATAGANNTLNLWSISIPGQAILQELAHTTVPSQNSMPTITGIAWSPDGKVIAVTGNSLFFYTAKLPKQPLELFCEVPRKGSTFDYKGCMFIDSSTLLVFKRYHTVPRTSAVVLYRVKAGQCVSLVKEREFVTGAHHTVFSSNKAKTCIAFGTVRGDIIVLCCETLEVLFETKAHMYCITGVTFASCDNVVISVGLDKRVVCSKIRSKKWRLGPKRASITLGLAAALLLVFFLVILV